MLSAAGPQTAVKALRALLNLPKSDLTLVLDADPDLPAERLGLKTVLKRLDGGYRTYTHALGYGVWQLVAVTQRKGFLPSLDDESLWQALRDPACTAPLLRSWVPYLMAELSRDGGAYSGRHATLRPAASFGCNAAVLTATNREIEAAVSAGLKAGTIKVE